VDLITNSPCLLFGVLVNSEAHPTDEDVSNGVALPDIVVIIDTIDFLGGWLFDGRRKYQTGANEFVRRNLRVFYVTQQPLLRAIGMVTKLIEEA